MKKSMMIACVLAGSVFAAEPNLLLNAKAEASSLETKSLVAAYAVDGKMNTRWASKTADNQTLTLDMGAEKKVGRILINWEYAAGKEYKIQFSKDGKTWTDVASVEDGKISAKKEITIPPQDTRFIRVACIKRASQYGFSIWEISAFAK